MSMFGRNSAKAELERLNRKLEVATQALGKLADERAQLDSAIGQLDAADDAAVDKLLARQRGLAEKADLLQRQVDLTKSAIERATAAVAAEAAAARAQRVAELRAAFRKAEQETHEETVAAEKKLKACVEKVATIASELAQLERDLPFSFWLEVTPNNPLPGCALALQREADHREHQASLRVVA